MFQQTVEITTDASGNFTHTATKSVLFGITVGITGTLLSPANETVNGTFQIVSQDGSVTNPPKQLQAVTGQQVDLGRWQLAHGVNQISVAGSTVPAAANAQLSFQIDASL